MVVSNLLIERGTIDLYGWTWMFHGDSLAGGESVVQLTDLTADWLPGELVGEVVCLDTRRSNHFIVSGNTEKHLDHSCGLAKHLLRRIMGSGRQSLQNL